MSYDTLFEQVSLLQDIGTEGLVSDYSNHPASIVAPNGALSVPSNYVLFNGTSNYWDLDLGGDGGQGSADFCYEFDFRFNSVSAAQVFMTNEDSTDTNKYRWQLTAGGVFQILVDGVVKHSFSPDPLTIYMMTWARVGTTFRFFVDGAKQGSDVVMNPTFESGHLRIGASSGTPGSWLSARYFHSRITIGNGRYTADYTPPTLPFPKLLAQIAGVTKDATDTPAARLVRAYRRTDGVKLFDGNSDGTGHYTFDVKTSDEVNVIEYDNIDQFGSGQRNDQIIRVKPLGP